MLMRCITGYLAVKSYLLTSISVVMCLPSETDFKSDSLESRLVLGNSFDYLCKSILNIRGLTGEGAFISLVV